MEAPSSTATIAGPPAPAQTHTHAPTSKSGKSKDESFTAAFGHLLDARILRALAKLGYSRPTPVQLSSVPVALSGRDVLARARTGSGKTLAYALPLVQKVLLAKKALSKSDTSYQRTRAMVLVPTRELSEQVTAQLGALLPFLERDVSVVNVARDASHHVHKVLLSERPDIVVATPSRALAHVQAVTLDLSNLETLAIDEADLILSYGHDEALRSLPLPKGLQCLCMSATMTKDVTALKGLVLHNKPAILDIADPELSNLTQFKVIVESSTDKFLLLYVILKLRLIRGKCIIFVNDVDRGYRLKLFLEQFAIKSTVLNEELPVNSRYHIVQEFNKGVYDYIIATDESRFGADATDDEGVATRVEEVTETEANEGAEDGENASGDEQGEKGEEGEGKDKEEEATASKSKGKKHKPAKGEGKSSKKHEYGASRGIDFVAVSCVVNFDLPVSTRGYTHRVGRTARAGNTGTSLSFVVPEEAFRKDTQPGSSSRPLVCATTERDETVYAKIEAQEQAKGQEIRDWRFDKKQVDAFRYRMEDALRSVTRASIREARIKEIKNELLNSERLKAHFEDNPSDLLYLRHDKALHPTRVQPHLRHVPSYLMPRIRSAVPAPAPAPVEGGDAAKRKRVDDDAEGLGYVTFAKNRNASGARGGRGRGRGRGRGGASSNGRSMSKKKKADPLRKFGK